MLAGATLAVLTAVLLARNGAGAEVLPRDHWGRHLPARDTSSANAAMTTAHYEYLYGYDKDGAWRDHWVVVGEQTAYLKDFNEPAVPTSARRAYCA
jgi:hypothetical protein